METFQLPFKFDTSKIKEEIAQFSKADYYDISNPSVQFETLWAKHLIEPIGGPDEEIRFLPNKALEKCPYILSILNSFQCDKETFRIHILDPGAQISPHRDNGYSFADGKVRIHIPVETSDEVELLLNNKPTQLRAGECWYCNFQLTHEVHNKSDKPRVHLIMDCIVNDWLSDVFEVSSN